MTKPGRLPCVNPRCRRTAPASQFGECDIICRACWKLLPQRLRDRYAQLRRREKRLSKLVEKRVMRGNIAADVIERIEHRITDQEAENWQLMRDYFRTSEKPLGLEGFLQEMGL
jgi:hypothetical protein